MLVCLGVGEIKNGDNVGYIGADGRPISGFNITEDGASVEGTPEYSQKVQQIQGDVTKQVKSLREQFDVFETDEGKQSQTDINPETQGPEIAKWALNQTAYILRLDTILECPLGYLRTLCLWIDVCLRHLTLCLLYTSPSPRDS